MNSDLENEAQGISPSEAMVFRRFIHARTTAWAHFNGQCIAQPAHCGMCCILATRHLGPHRAYATRAWALRFAPKAKHQRGVTWYGKGHVRLGDTQP